MCGIFGFYSYGEQETPDGENLMQAMCFSLKHRGPDDDGYFLNQRIGLGNTRLSILDVEGGHQPFYSDNRQIIIVQNGEIFNYIELQKEIGPCKTNCDTEVLLRLYEKYGIGFLKKLNGMFAIALYDKRIDTLFLIRDRVGVKPLYFYNNDHQYVFASEIKTILQTQKPFPLNWEALDLLLSFNYIPPPHTIYQGIEHVMPGSYVAVTKRGICHHRWWNLIEIERSEETDEKEWIERFNHTLQESVKIRLRSDVPLGAFLSGGVDSTTIVGLMSKQIKDPIQTFCIGFEDPHFDESLFALEASKRFNTYHVNKTVACEIFDLWPKIIYHCDQPHGDISFIPTFLLSQLAQKSVKVVLTGDGGDELFAGYEKYLSFYKNNLIKASKIQINAKQYEPYLSLFSTAFKEQLYTLKILKETARNELGKKLIQRIFKDFSHHDPINQMLALDVQLLLPGNNLVKPDRMGMAVGLEARAPFLDYRMIHLAFQMPGFLKLKDNTTKYIYKKAVTSLIGKKLAYRKKQMFTVPIGEWIRTTIYKETFNHFNNKNSILHFLFEPKMMMDLLHHHQCKKVNYTRELRMLLAIDLWWEEMGKYCSLA